MKVNIEKFEKYVVDGLLRKQNHPKYDLIIWNYTPIVSFTKAWDEVTIMSRGLVTDSLGNVMCNCLPKFFNHEELNGLNINIPDEDYDVYKKMDGSYINIFTYNHELIFTSRGSFISDQSVLATNIFNKKYVNNVNINPNYNYILEIIGVDNQIVIRYPDNDLILLAVFDLENNEINIKSNEFHGFNVVKKIGSNIDFKTLKNQIPDDEEGYVIKFKSGFRMKIKGVNYCRLHSIVTNVSNVSIWEMLKDKKDLSVIIENIPDEWYQYVQTTIADLNKLYDGVEATALNQYSRIYYGDGKIDRKEFALEALKSDFSGLLFCIYNKKDYSQAIWKMCKPRFCKPFKIIEEE